MCQLIQTCPPIRSIRSFSSIKFGLYSCDIEITVDRFVDGRYVISKLVDRFVDDVTLYQNLVNHQHSKYKNIPLDENIAVHPLDVSATVTF